MKIHVFFLSLLIAVGGRLCGQTKIDSLVATASQKFFNLYRYTNDSALSPMTLSSVDSTEAVVSGSLLKIKRQLRNLSFNLCQNYYWNTSTPNATLSIGTNFTLVPITKLHNIVSGEREYLAAPWHEKVFYGEPVVINSSNYNDSVIPYQIKIKNLEPLSSYELLQFESGYYIIPSNYNLNDTLFKSFAYNWSNTNSRVLKIAGMYNTKLTNAMQVTINTTGTKPLVPRFPPPDTVYYGADHLFSNSDTLGLDSIYAVTKTSLKMAMHFNLEATLKTYSIEMPANGNYTVMPANSFGTLLNLTELNNQSIVINSENYEKYAKRISFDCKYDGIPYTTVPFSCSAVIITNKWNVLFCQKLTSSFVPFLVFYSNWMGVVQMATKSIGNNYLPKVSQVVCPEVSSATGDLEYNPLPIIGSVPFGSLDTCEYIWQKMTGSGTWTNCTARSSKNKDYTVGTLKVKDITDSVIRYRRIVFNGVHSDTSNTCSMYCLRTDAFTAYSQKLPAVKMRDVTLEGKSPTLHYSINSLYPLSNYVVTDTNTYLKTSNTYTTLSDKLTIANGPNAEHHMYTISAKLNGSCPATNGVTVNVTPPDGDGNNYPAVSIGAQKWLATNLRATRFNDGSPISAAFNTSLKTPANYKWFNNDSILNAFPYGALYNPVTVLNDKQKNVCPVGWRPATAKDWDVLITTCGGDTVAGNSLKIKRGWYTDNGATNASNFNALPSGNSINGFYGKGLFVSWWGLDTDASKPPVYYEVTTVNGRVYKMWFDTQKDILNMYHAIRCVKSGK